MEGDRGSSALMSQMMLYSKPMFGLDIWYIENPFRLDKIDVLILSNDDYFLQLAHSTVPICDRQFMIKNSVSLNLKECVSNSTHMSSP